VVLLVFPPCDAVSTYKHKMFSWISFETSLLVAFLLFYSAFRIYCSFLRADERSDFSFFKM